MAVGSVSLSPSATKALCENGAYSLSDLMIQRDLGILDSKDYSSEVFAN